MNMHLHKKQSEGIDVWGKETNEVKMLFNLCLRSGRLVLVKKQSFQDTYDEDG